MTLGTLLTTHELNFLLNLLKYKISLIYYHNIASVGDLNVDYVYNLDETTNQYMTQTLSKILFYYKVVCTKYAILCEVYVSTSMTLRSSWTGDIFLSRSWVCRSWDFSFMFNGYYINSLQSYVVMFFVVKTTVSLKYQ